MFGVVQPPAEAHHTLDLLVPQRAMRGSALGVVEFGVAGDLDMAHGAGACLSGLNKRSANTSPLKRRLNMPAFDERHWRRLATRRVLPEIKFQKSDDSPVCFGHKNDRSHRSILKVPSCFDVVVRERPWPERLAQPNLVRPVTFEDLSDRHH
jgi:hypothetical protein